MDKDTQPEHNAHLKYRPDIDGLRAIAILSVVIFHAFPEIFQGGFVGVDIFFVISGFLISSIILRSLQRGDFSFAEFYAHRARRIFPALIVMLCATYTFGWFALLPDEFAQLGKHMAASAGFVQNIVLYREAGYFDTASELKPLMHLWSLAIEEQFYLVYPLLILAAWRMGLNVLTVVILLALFSFTLNIWGLDKNIIKTFFLPQTRVWELLAGATLAYLQVFKRQQTSSILQFFIFHPLLFRSPPEANRREAILNNLLSAFGLILIIASLAIINKGFRFPGWWALWPVAGSFLIIMAGPSTWINKNIIGNQIMVMVGLISYPLYLWHWPVLSFARIMERGEPPRSVLWAAVAASFLLAWLTYKVIEKPIRFGNNNLGKTAIVATLLAAVGLAGFTTFQKDGLSFRAGMQALSEKTKDLSWDISGLSYGKCDSYLVDQDPKLSYCSVSKANSNPTMAMIGDSHADSNYHGIAKNDSRNWLLIGNYSCPPITGVNTSTASGTCEKLMEKAIDYVGNSDSINTVVLSFFGNYALDESYAADHLRSGKGMAGVQFKSDIFKTENKADLFFLGLDRAVNQLVKAGKKVVITIDTPELPFLPRDCIDRPMMAKTNDCVVPRHEADQRQAVQRMIIQKVAQAHPGVRVFDPTGILCDDNYCRAMINDVLVYRDSHHLSLRGSNLYGKSFLTWLNSADQSANR